MKRMVSLLLAALLALAAAGCGGAAQPKDVDVTALAAELAEKVSYDGTLKELTEKQLSGFMTLPEGAQAAAYMSNGTTAEEIVAAKCASEEDAKAFLETVKSYLADQRAELERYQPQEVARMEQAVLAQRGVYVVLCVSADSAAAEQIIKEHLG